MKRNITLIGTALIGLTVLAFFVFNNQLNSEAGSDYLTKEAEEELQEGATADAYAQWLNGMRANPLTGIVGETDILKAREQLKAYYASHEGSRGGGLLGLEWENFGPNNVGGRMRAILIDRTNTQRIYAAGISGGLYCTDNGGLQWYPHPQNDEFTSMLVSSMAQASNGDIYFGTGEYWADYFDGGSGSYTHGFAGDGMYWAPAVTGDALPVFEQLTSTIPTAGTIGSTSGATWAYVNRVACHPTEPGTVVAATNTGLKISKDGGASWDNCNGDGSALLSISDDAAFDADGYLHAISSGQRKYYRSIESSIPEEMMEYAEGLDAGSIRRVLAVAPSDPNYVYIYSAKSGTLGFQGVYQSSNRGESFTKITEEASEFFNPNGTGANAKWNLCIAVNPADPLRIYIGGQLEAWTWNGSTTSWVPMSFWAYPTWYEKYIHADHHYIAFPPDYNTTTKDYMYFATDGGISRSTNASAAYPNFGTLNKGLNFYQCHGVSIGIQGEAMGGSQDNGTQYVNFDLNSVLQSVEVLGGDGGKAEISRIRPEYLFATSFAVTANGTGAVLRRSVNAGSSMASIYDCNIDGGTSSCSQDGLADGGTDFVTPFVLWENYELYETFAAILEGDTVEYPAGSGDLYALNDVVTYEGREITLDRSGLSESRLYHAVKANLWVTTGALFNSTEAPLWFKILTGSGNVTSIEYSTDGDIAYVGTAGGRLYRLSGLLTANFEYVDVDGDPETAGVFNAVDAGITTYTYPTVFANDVTGISINRNNPDEVSLCLGGYGLDQNVWHSENALDNDGATWECISDGGALPDIPAFDILVHLSDPDKILIATEFGVWSYSLSSGGDWTQEALGIVVDGEQKVGPGNVPVFEIREDWIRETNCHAIYIGTHGNGYFRTTTLSVESCEFDPVSSGPIQEEIIAGFSLNPNPADVSTTATFTLTQSATVATMVYSMAGNLVKVVGTSNYSAGSHNISIDINNLNPGSYMVSLEINGTVTSRRLVVI